jgi:hypothetical protein
VGNNIIKQSDISRFSPEHQRQILEQLGGAGQLVDISEDGPAVGGREVVPGAPPVGLWEAYPFLMGVFGVWLVIVSPVIIGALVVAALMLKVAVFGR